VLLDFDQRPYDTTLFAVIASRLDELISQSGGEWSGPGSRGAMPLGLFADQALAQQAGLSGMVATAVDPRMFNDRPALVTAAATLIGGGKVKIATPADERSRRLPLPIGDIRPDAPASAALDAALIALAMSLPAELRTWEQRAPHLPPRRARVG
jgi:hypothetical protein